MELRIDSVYPTLGELGKDLQVTINGSEFEVNSRISMYLNSGNQRAIIGVLYTPGEVDDLTIVDTTAYAADAKGLVIVPVPTEIKPFIINNATSISATLTDSTLNEHYSLRLFNDNESDRYSEHFSAD
jgi:hypothetical protein